VKHTKGLPTPGHVVDTIHIGNSTIRLCDDAFMSPDDVERSLQRISKIVTRAYIAALMAKEEAEKALAA